MKIFTWIEPTTGMLCIVLEEERGPGFHERWVAKPVSLVFEKVDETAETPPTLRLPHRLAREFMQSMAEIADRLNFKTEKDARLAGTIEAMRDHMKDLQGMLKMKNLLPK